MLETRVCTACLLVFVGCSAEPTTSQDESNVIEGDVASDVRWDAVGALVRVNQDAPSGYESFCTGTLIDSTVVLTALHCVDSLEPTDVWFALGFDASTPSRVIPVARIEKNLGALLEVSHTDGDTATLELAEVVAEITPVGIRHLTSNDIGASFTAIGYGYNTPSMDQRGVRRMGPSTLVALENEYVTKVGRRYSGDAPICPGDSGGPLLAVVDDTLHTVGVASQTSLNSQGECVNPATYVRFGSRYCEGSIEADQTGCAGNAWVKCEAGLPDGPELDVLIDCATLNPPRICEVDSSGRASCVSSP